ncbi:hypothetical protein [Microcoleus sp. FACHB-SPT15]|nr:hypothetical protein [Microcoleus sp. FACHB-SPT15]
MKRLVSSIFLTGCLWAIANLSDSRHQPQGATSSHPLHLALNLMR